MFLNLLQDTKIRYTLYLTIFPDSSPKKKKYTLSSLGKNARFRNFEDSFIWLNEAMVINICYNATDPNIGLALKSARWQCSFDDPQALNFIS